VNGESGCALRGLELEIETFLLLPLLLLLREGAVSWYLERDGEWWTDVGDSTMTAIVRG
jgi:hypothetical protein